MTTDTIVAQATAPGRGGVGIVRVSGPAAEQVAEIVLGKLPRVRYAEYLPFRDEQGQALDQGIALLFKAPNSFTGEDVLELQGHGGPVVLPVDEVDGVHNIEERELMAASLSGEQASAKYTRGVLQWKTRSLRWLDEEQLLGAITRSLT